MDTHPRLGADQALQLLICAFIDWKGQLDQLIQYNIYYNVQSISVKTTDEKQQVSNISLF